ncbi:Ig-like domain-containing domain [Flaviaesturariibacter terrae]
MKRISFLAAAFLLLLLAHIGNSCANIVPPAGGPKDSLPPRLVKATPADSSTNVSAKTIELTFNEYIDLQDTRNNLTVSPMYEIQPEISAKLRTLTIKLKDTLEPNTTYTFNFGNAIRDITENNVLRGFAYTFSTGPALDSLSLSGTVTLAETGGTDTTMLVELYRNLDDSAVVKQGPRYITHPDPQGRFVFHNLPAGTFAVYALEDKNNRRYLAKSQLFGFIDSSVHTGSRPAPLEIHAYREAAAAATGAAGAPRAPVQPATDRRLKYNTPGGPQDLFGSYRISFDNKLKKFDSSRIRLLQDSSTTVVPRVRLDSTGRVLSLSTTWNPGSAYTLILEKDFATDSTGRSQLRNDTLHFSAKRSTDYGKLRLRFRNAVAGTHPVLQFVQNGNVVYSASIAGGVLNNDLFAPGDYELRVLFDRNGNGQWDPGHFFGERRQPEIVKPIERRLTVKADIENEIEIAVPDAPAR